MKISPWPYFDDEQIGQVVNVLKKGKVNSWHGNETKNFEKEFASWSNNKYAIAIANGSLALSSAYLSLNIGKGDEVITTPRTFIATASSISLLKAVPIFADVDINSGNITAKNIEPLISKKTKAISVVHLAGWPAEMIEIKKLAKEYKLNVIEDCAQSHGAKIKLNGDFKSVGSFGDVAAWSFCQDKIISTGGEGGMITTDNNEIFKRIWSLKDHGKSYELSFKKTDSYCFRWLHENFGSNFRLTEMQSAIGRSQLKLMNDWHQKRTRNAMILYEILSQITNLRIPIPPDNLIHAWYKFHCYIRENSLLDGWNRDRIVNEIRKKSYPAFSGSCSEIYLEKCFKKNSIKKQKRLMNAKSLGESSLMFLVHPTITIDQMKEYALTIKSILDIAKR